MAKRKTQRKTRKVNKYYKMAKRKTQRKTRKVKKQTGGSDVAEAASEERMRKDQRQEQLQLQVNNEQGLRRELANKGGILFSELRVFFTSDICVRVFNVLLSILNICAKINKFHDKKNKDDLIEELIQRLEDIVEQTHNTAFPDTTELVALTQNGGMLKRRPSSPSPPPSKPIFFSTGATYQDNAAAEAHKRDVEEAKYWNRLQIEAEKSRYFYEYYGISGIKEFISNNPCQTVLILLILLLLISAKISKIHDEKNKDDLIEELIQRLEEVESQTRAKAEAMAAHHTIGQGTPVD